MSMGKDELRGYSKGYNAGRRKNQWPEHRPPTPPAPIVALLTQAASALRDECDSLCATLSEDDDFVRRLEPHIDAVDTAMAALTIWLRSENKETPHDR